MYTIGQVAEMFGVPVSTLRYYDKEGLFPEMRRVSGIRQFSEKEIEALRVIECLKKSGLEIRDIKQFMQWCTQGSETYAQRRELFEKQRGQVESEIQRLGRVLDMLKFKCWYYEQAVRDGDEARLSRLRPEEMPEMCQIGKMEFALPTNCTYYGEAEVEGSETIYLYMEDYQVVVSSDPFPHDISLTDMDEATLELYIGSLSEGSYQIAGCQAAVVGKYPYLLLAYHDEALETDYSVYHTIIDGQVYTFVGYREGDEPVSEQEQEFLYELLSTMTEAPEEDEA